MCTEDMSLGDLLYLFKTTFFGVKKVYLINSVLGEVNFISIIIIILYNLVNSVAPSITVIY